MNEIVKKTKDGAILYDKALIDQISDEQFTASSWPNSEILTGRFGSSGRGNTFYIGNKPREYVLRHYNRGGLLSKIVNDSYIFCGEQNTRPFLEWRLLKNLSMKNMNVPHPVAARFCRYGLFYKADLITICIPKIISLSEYIAIEERDNKFWRFVGESIWKFHKVGVNHTDLNAYNIQVNKNGEVWVIDFDKCKIMQPGIWMQENLNRLYRSLLKIIKLDPKVHFDEEKWKNLKAGYSNASKSS